MQVEHLEQRPRAPLPHADDQQSGQLTPIGGIILRLMTRSSLINSPYDSICTFVRFLLAYLGHEQVPPDVGRLFGGRRRQRGRRRVAWHLVEDEAYGEAGEQGEAGQQAGPQPPTHVIGRWSGVAVSQSAGISKVSAGSIRTRPRPWRRARAAFLRETREERDRSTPRLYNSSLEGAVSSASVCATWSGMFAPPRRRVLTRFSLLLFSL